jgi:uncharacterized RDD family membrane protein YckC/DNA-directed RNA polymerase specialized sigma24 family protein
MASGETPPPGPGPEDRPLPARLLGAGTRTGLRVSRTVARTTGIDREIEDAVEEAVVRALESPATERALARALASPAVERSVYRALDSEALDRIWAHLLASDEAQKLVERIAQAPEVRAAIAYQGVGLLQDLQVQVRRVVRRIDDALERIARRLLRRPAGSESSRYAGVASRAVAFLFDAGILNFAFFAVSAIIAFIVSALTSTGDSQVSTPALVAGIGAWLIFGSAYLLFFWSLAGQTPGMRVLGIRLSSDDGTRLGLRRSFRRLVGLVSGVLTLGIGFLLILFDDRRRGIQDRVARTEVVYEPLRPGPAALKALREEGLGDADR